MKGWLLDTNILSELRKPRPNAKVIAFIGGQSIDSLYVSVVTLAEIRFGIESVSDLGQRIEIQDWLTHKVRPMFDQRILPVSEDVMFIWRLMVEKGRKIGHTFSQPDLIIAATAFCYDLTIVSRDTADYERTGVPLINPLIDAR